MEISGGQSGPVQMVLIHGPCLSARSVRWIST